MLYFPIQLFLITLSGRNYVYYFISWVPFLTLAFGLVGSIFVDIRKDRSTGAAAGILFLGLGLAAAYFPLVLLVNGYAAPLHPAQPEIAKYVTENSTPDETILAWGKETTYIYFVTQRRSPTRYFYQAPVTLESYNSEHLVSAEILHDIQAQPPELFLIFSSDPNPPAAGTCPFGTSDQQNTPGAIFKYVCDHYQYAAFMDDIQVYRLKP
jgi:hypothetical protein